jgi:hypothetical protein
MPRVGTAPDCAGLVKAPGASACGRVPNMVYENSADHTPLQPATAADDRPSI